ncbi:MAG TPA: hypothetical protein VGD14_12315, partial [bacterium]
WTQKNIVAILAMLVIGMGVAGIFSVESIPFWLVSGLLSGVVLIIVYILGFRYHLSFIPFASLAVIWLSVIKEMVFNAYPGVIVGAVVAINLVGILAVYWFLRLNAGR